MREIKKIEVSKIDISAIQNEMPSIAFSLFRLWTQSVNVKYPNLNLTINDERLIVKNFEKSLRSALKSLLESGKFSKGSFLMGWDIGYVLGFIKGNLGSHWVYEYITKQSEIYKIYVALKVTSQFLEFDNLTEIKLNRLYDHFIENDSNLAEIELEIPVKDIDFDKKINMKDSDEKGKVKALIDTQMIKLILKMAKKGDKNDDFNMPIDDFLSKTKIEALISVNKAIFES